VYCTVRESLILQKSDDEERSIRGSIPCPTSVVNVTFVNRFDGSVNFTRPWSDYKAGFGSIDGEFWLGLDCLHNLTTTRNYSLQVDFTDFEGTSYQSWYNRFSVGPESEDEYKSFILTADGYDRSSTGGDNLWPNNRMYFSTFDRGHKACARGRRGGFWYQSCGNTNPTGLYIEGGQENWSGITWFRAKDSPYSFKTMRYTIIPK